MSIPPLSNTGPVDLDEFRSLAAFPGVMLAIEGHDGVLRWCNERFAKSFGKTPESMVGMSMRDYLPDAFVDEKLRLWQSLLEHGKRVEYFQLFNDQRYLKRGAILADDVMGPNLLLFTCFPETAPSGGHETVATAPYFAAFSKLSRAELRVLHAFATGATRDQIARKLHRSIHTVNDHLKNVYAKLGVDREVDLALSLGRSGIGAFTDDQWEQIIARVPGGG